MGAPVGVWGFVWGVCMAVMGTLFNSLGINMQRKFHFDNNRLPVMDRLPCWQTRTWVVGISVYLGSQIFAALALGVLPTIVMAPLFSTGLVFNAIFACALVGEAFGPRDFIGTVLSTLGSALVSIAGYIPQDDYSLHTLIQFLRRGPFVALFLLQVVGMIAMVAYADREVRRGRGRRHDDSRTLCCGILYGVVAGVLCSMTFILGKCCVELVKGMMSGRGHELKDITAYLILLALLLFGALNIFYLNVAMNLVDVTLVGPLTYSVFLIFSLANGVVFFDLSNAFSGVQRLVIAAGTALLLMGMFSLSYPKQSGKYGEVTEGSAGSSGQSERKLLVSV